LVKNKLRNRICYCFTNRWTVKAGGIFTVAAALGEEWGVFESSSLSNSRLYYDALEVPFKYLVGVATPRS